MTKDLTFIVPVGDDGIYQRCFQSSPLFRPGAGFEILCQRGFKSAAKAFNDGIDRARNDLLVFCHQDIVLPASWADTFLARLGELDRQDPHWGVVGCAGRTRSEGFAVHLYRHDREWRGSVPLPAEVRTLDECIIAFRRSSGLRFDEGLAGFFFYAVDICLEAETRRCKNYAIDAPCFHQAKDRETSLPKAFFEAERRVVDKWRERLPIQTPSGRIVGRGHLVIKRLRSRWREFLSARGFKKSPWWGQLPVISPERLLQ